MERRNCKDMNECRMIICPKCGGNGEVIIRYLLMADMLYNCRYLICSFCYDLGKTSENRFRKYRNDK